MRPWGGGRASLLPTIGLTNGATARIGRKINRPVISPAKRAQTKRMGGAVTMRVPRGTKAPKTQLLSGDWGPKQPSRSLASLLAGRDSKNQRATRAPLAGPGRVRLHQEPLSVRRAWEVVRGSRSRVAQDLRELLTLRPQKSRRPEEKPPGAIPHRKRLRVRRRSCSTRRGRSQGRWGMLLQPGDWWGFSQRRVHLDLRGMFRQGWGKPRNLWGVSPLQWGKSLRLLATCQQRREGLRRQ